MASTSMLVSLVMLTLPPFVSPKERILAILELVYKINIKKNLGVGKYGINNQNHMKPGKSVQWHVVLIPQM